MITLLLLLIPLLGVLGLHFFKKGNAAFFTLAVTFVQLAVTAFALYSFTPNAEVQFALDLPWIRSLGIHFHIGMDGISLLLVLLTNLLLPVIVMSSLRIRRSAGFYALMLIMQSGLVGVFTSLDGFLFYIFWEVALLPAYLICLIWGGERKVFITFRFFIYTLAGSLLMLAAFILVYLNTPAPHSFGISAMYDATLNPSVQNWVFLCLFLAFAIKMPVFPFHTWQPDTYADAPSQGTMLLSGIMLKMGIYGLIRWLLPLAPAAVMEWGHVALYLSIAGIIYASLIAWMQKDLKRLFAYSSIAHVGLISAGVFTLSESGMQGAMVQMLSHGIIVTGLFFVAQILQERLGHLHIERMGGIRSAAPQFAGLFLLVLLGSIGLPLTSGFVGEFLLLSGIYQYKEILGFLGGTSIILGAVYMLNAYRKIMLGPGSVASENFQRLAPSEVVTLSFITGMILLLGIFPGPVFDIAGPSLQKIIQLVR